MRIRLYIARAARNCTAARTRTMATETEGPLYLGFDSSTQSLKVTAIDRTLKVFASYSLNYGKTYKDVYPINDSGIIIKPDHVVTQPSIMYVDALERILEEMKAESFPFHRVEGVSGSGQQHGSVYLSRGSEKKLQSLTARDALTTQLSDCFALPESPIWMDSSTSAQCRTVEDAVGGAEALAAITGSRAYERFTLHQILKIMSTAPAAYERTERISLISSFLCSVLLGGYASIDLSDGSGMNLLDIRSHKWSDKILTAVGAVDLPTKLGDPCPSHQALGHISKFFADKYGFSPSCRVVAWSGDNPCSLAGLGLQQPGDIAVSLGTSDTLFGLLEKPTPGADGHVFVSPVDPKSYMGMLCFKNGGLVRQRFCKELAGGDWKAFNYLIRSTPPGNKGNLGIFYDYPEITPTANETGAWRFETVADGLLRPKEGPFKPAADARALIEGQFLALRFFATTIGLALPKRIIVTGGASANTTVLQVLADVFNTPVYATSQTDSASLGAAVRALHGVRCEEGGGFVPFSKVLALGSDGPRKVCDPLAASAYKSAIEAFGQCIGTVQKHPR